MEELETQKTTTFLYTWLVQIVESLVVYELAQNLTGFLIAPLILFWSAEVVDENIHN